MTSVSTWISSWDARRPGFIDAFDNVAGFIRVAGCCLVISCTI